MAILRFKALELVSQRKAGEVVLPSLKISEYFGENVFGLDAMRATMSSEYYKRLRRTTEAGEQVDRNLADAVAAAMKTWAISKGATHYTHWFQPLTGATAEKHDSFFDLLRRVRQLRISKAAPLCSKSRMHLLSRAAVSATRSRHAAIAPGTRLLPLS